MVAARSWPGREDDADPYFSLTRADASDWLSLQHAACELGVSVSTLRRRLRKGKLRNRVVPHNGGYRYLIYVPNAQHRSAAPHLRLVGGTEAPPDDEPPPALPPAAAYGLEAASSNGHASADEVAHLRDQVDRLSEALSRALRVRQRSLPQGVGDPDASPADPYGRYRWLARKRRWWPF